MQIMAEVDDQQPVIAVRSEETQNECLCSQNGPVHTARRLCAEHRVAATHVQQVTMKPVDDVVFFAFAEIKLAGFERGRIPGIDVPGTHLCLSQSAELGEKLNAALADQRGQFTRMVGEEMEGAAGCEF